ncbi:MAG: glycosyltransferase family 4 protein [Planctomycetes bacterium]|nr:glycosyltransferase family 4 protein [Planctomycetota bacterium]
MKIAFVVYNWSESKGGVERYAYNLADYLAKEGDEIHIFCHRVFEKPKSDKITLNIVPTFPFYSPLKYLFFARNVAKMLNDQGFDIIQHFGRTYYCASGPTRPVSQVYRIGYGCHWEYLKYRYPSMNNIFGRIIQHLNPRNRIVMHLERKSFAEARRSHIVSGKSACSEVICNSKRGKEEVQRYYHIADENIRVIYNAVDLNRFNVGNSERYRSQTRSKMELEESDTVLLFVGNNFEMKGLRFAIEGMALVPADKRSHIKLLVVGDGNAARYRAVAKKYNIEGQVLFAGSQSQIERYYAASDIFLFPPLYEPSSNVCLEAMASGLPVITTRINGVSEIISNATDSFIIETSSDTKTIAEKIIFLLDQARRKSISKAAALTASKYSFEDNFKPVKELYKEIIKK